MPGEAETVAATSEAAPVTDTSATTGASTEVAATTTDTVVAGAGTDSISATEGPTRPEGLPDEFWDATGGVKTGDLWNAFQDLKGKHDELTADVPAEAKDYALDLAGVEVPEGFKLDIDETDPFVAAARAAAVEGKVTKAGWNGMVKAYAAAQIEDQKAATAEYAAEKAKLGDTADGRIKAVTDWLGANLTGEQAKALAGVTYSAAIVQALEKIIRLRSDAPAAQGGAGNISALEGLRGGDLLDHLRTKAA